MIIGTKEIKIGDTINFHSLSKYDNTVWRGKVLGFCAAEMARGYDDILAIHRQIEASVDEIGPYTTLEYMILEMQDNNTGKTTHRVFAKEWMEPASLVIEDIGNTIRIEVYNIPNAQAQQVVDLLRSHGYICAQKSAW